MIPAILDLAKNLVLNKRFKTEFFKGFKGFLCQENIPQTVTENTWQDFRQKYLAGFKRKNFNRKARKENIRLRRINIHETSV